jgi:hypothetical protein
LDKIKKYHKVIVIKLVESIDYINTIHNSIIIELCKSKKIIFTFNNNIIPIKNTKWIETPRNLSCVIIYINTKTIVKYEG